MTTDILKYSINDVNNIKEDGFSFVLPEKTIEIINKIAEQVGSIGYVKTPSFNRKSKKKNKAIDPALIANIDFKKHEPKPDENKETIENYVKNIKSGLNKITEKTYDIIRNDILNNIKSIIEQTDSSDDESFDKICSFIFEYSTTNKGQVVTLAKLYVELMEKYPVLKFIFDRKFNSYITMFNKIEQRQDSIDDYDYYCKISLLNQRRRIFSMFIIELYKNNIIEIESIVNIIIALQADLVYSVNWNNESTKCEELSENIYIFVSNICSSLLKHRKWKDINENIEAIKNTSVKDVISMTNKIKFKHMDIMDVIKKENIYKPPSSTK